MEQVAAGRAEGAGTQFHPHHTTVARRVEHRARACALQRSRENVSHHLCWRGPSHHCDSQQQLKQLPHAHVVQGGVHLYVRTQERYSMAQELLDSLSLLAQH